MNVEELCKKIIQEGRWEDVAGPGRRAHYVWGIPYDLYIEIKNEITEEEDLTND